MANLEFSSSGAIASGPASLSYGLSFDENGVFTGNLQGSYQVYLFRQNIRLQQVLGYSAV
jgi:hypothetical protein